MNFDDDHQKEWEGKMTREIASHLYILVSFIFISTDFDFNFFLFLDIVSNFAMTRFFSFLFLACFLLMNSSSAV